MFLKKMTRRRSDLQRKQRVDLLRSAGPGYAAESVFPIENAFPLERDFPTDFFRAEIEFQPDCGCSCETPFLARTAAILAKRHSGKNSPKHSKE